MELLDIPQSPESGCLAGGVGGGGRGISPEGEVGPRWVGGGKCKPKKGGGVGKGGCVVLAPENKTLSARTFLGGVIVSRIGLSRLRAHFNTGLNLKSNHCPLSINMRRAFCSRAFRFYVMVLM